MIDSVDSSKQEPRLNRRDTNRRLMNRSDSCGKFVARLTLSNALAGCVGALVAVTSATAQQPLAPEDLVPIKVDRTASLVRLAPKILICNPSKQAVGSIDQSAKILRVKARRHIVSPTAFASPIEDDTANRSQEYAPLPAPVPTETVEVEVPQLVSPVPIRDSVISEEEPSVLSAETNDTGAVLVESDVLDLGNVNAERGVSEMPKPQIVSWIDIRPRSIRPSSNPIVSADVLPDDTSGLPVQSQPPRLVQLPASDLLMRDFWCGASFYHQPLYFQDRRLERYGSISSVLRHCPSVHSGVHFVLRAGMLPASIVMVPPNKCVRSGACTNPVLDRLR